MSSVQGCKYPAEISEQKYSFMQHENNLTQLYEYMLLDRSDEDTDNTDQDENFVPGSISESPNSTDMASGFCMAMVENSSFKIITDETNL